MKAENVIGIVGVVALAGLVAWYSARYDALVANTGTVINTQGSGVVVNRTNESVPAPTGISATTVALHNTAADCWIVVSGNVYNVTDYLVRHPGGAFRITPFCGRDATGAFQTQGGEGQHTSLATQELLSRYVGELANGEIVPSTTNLNTSTITNTPIANTNAASPSGVSLSAAAVATHNRAGDCWIIVNGSVYNVTGYLTKHPGGASRITPYCGRDATAAFSTRGGTGTHSGLAAADLAALRLGALGSTTTAQTMNQTNANASAATPKGEVEDEREDNDDD